MTYPNFKVARSPTGWRKVDSVMFTNNGYGATIKPDTELYIDALRLVKTVGVYPDQARRWQFDHFGTYAPDGAPLIPAAEAGLTADPDADGRSNLLEYALASDPRAVTPAPAFTTDIVNNRLQLTFNRIADPLLTYTVQACDVLGTGWTDIWTSTGAANVSGPVTVTDTRDISAAPARFLHLRVSR